MNEQWNLVTVLTSVLFGGIVGAAAALLLTTQRAKEAAMRFKSAFLKYVSGKTDAETTHLVELYNELDVELKAVSETVDRLRRALKRKQTP